MGLQSGPRWSSLGDLSFLDNDICYQYMPGIKALGVVMVIMSALSLSFLIWIIIRRISSGRHIFGPVVLCPFFFSLLAAHEMCIGLLKAVNPLHFLVGKSPLITYCLSTAPVLFTFGVMQFILNMESFFKGYSKTMARKAQQSISFLFRIVNKSFIGIHVLTFVGSENLLLTLHFRDQTFPISSVYFTSLLTVWTYLLVVVLIMLAVMRREISVLVDSELRSPARNLVHLLKKIRLVETFIKIMCPGVLLLYVLMDIPNLQSRFATYIFLLTHISGSPVGVCLCFLFAPTTSRFGKSRSSLSVRNHASSNFKKINVKAVGGHFTVACAS